MLRCGFNTGSTRLAEQYRTGFAAALAGIAKATEDLLSRLLPPLPGNRLREAMRYAVLNGGKRLRPFLAVQSAALYDISETQALRVGAALEALHCYSLVHDDLPAMDNDDLRRGLPTVHRKFDEATAILAGDGLLTFAFEVLSDPATHADGNVRAALVLTLAKAAGQDGMVGGQMLDLLAEQQPFDTYAAIAAMQTQKTGALIRFACESGAIMAGQDARALRRYGECVGLAFQIVDDVLDVESDAAAVGKATQKDKKRGKASFVGLLGLDGAKSEARRLADEAISAVADFGDRARLLEEAARFIVSRRS